MVIAKWQRWKLSMAWRNLLGGVNAILVYLKPHEKQQWLKVAEFIFEMYENSLQFLFHTFSSFLLSSCQGKSGQQELQPVLLQRTQSLLSLRCCRLQPLEMSQQPLVAAGAGMGERISANGGRGSLVHVFVGAEMSALQGTAASGNQARLRSF